MQLNQAAISEVKIQPYTQMFEEKQSLVIVHAQRSQTHI